MAFREQAVSQMRAEETGCAGNKDVHILRVSGQAKR
jgi:hypothetical protein